MNAAAVMGSALPGVNVSVLLVSPQLNVLVPTPAHTTGATQEGDGALKVPLLIVPVRFPFALLVTNSTAAATIENVARFVIPGPFLVDGPVSGPLRWSLSPSQTRS